MADYYPLITRAVVGLEKSTGEGRRALYERARNALVEQLRSVTPALNETDITRERLALEEAIRKVEAEAVRQLRMEQHAERSIVAPLPQAADTDEAAPALEPEQSASEPEPQAEPATPRAPQRPPGTRRWLKQQSPSAPPEPSLGIKGFSDVVADAENLGDATAEAGRAARETYSSVPSPTPEFDRLEPRMEPVARRPAATPRARAPERRSIVPRSEYEPEDEAPAVERNYNERNYSSSSSASGRPLSSPAVPDSVRQVAERGRRAFNEDGDESLGRRLMGGAINLVIGAVLLLMLAGLVWWQGKNLITVVKNTFTSSRTTSTPAPQRDTTQQRAKIPDRIGQTDANTQSRPQTEVSVQRAVLYEDDPVEPAGRQFVGTVTWRTENSPPAAGQPPDRAIRAEINIPERNMQVNLTIRRNTDPGLTASHTVSIMFNLPPDFPNGGVSEIRGMLMKQAEDTRGTSLAGLAVKVTPTFFLVGLSSASDGDVQRNLQLLKERSWFDIAIVYNNGRRAILAVEKGGPGDRAFADAFAAWRQ